MHESTEEIENKARARHWCAVPLQTNEQCIFLVPKIPISALVCPVSLYFLGLLKMGPWLLSILSEYGHIRGPSFMRMAEVLQVWWRMCSS